MQICLHIVKQKATSRREWNTVVTKQRATDALANCPNGLLMCEVIHHRMFEISRPTNIKSPHQTDDNLLRSHLRRPTLPIFANYPTVHC